MTATLFDAPATAPTAVEPKVVRSASFSDDRAYRYHLDRSWGSGPIAVFIMLNPSTADANNDDPTVRRCMGFARSWGLSGIKVVNLYALRSTNPAGLWDVADPVGPDNDDVLAVVAHDAAVRDWPLVAAWGAHAQPERVARVMGLNRHMARVHALGTTKAGQPRHPLYLRGDAPLTAWAGAPSYPEQVRE